MLVGFKDPPTRAAGGMKMEPRIAVAIVSHLVAIAVWIQGMTEFLSHLQTSNIVPTVQALQSKIKRDHLRGRYYWRFKPQT